MVISGFWFGQLRRGKRFVPSVWKAQEQRGGLFEEMRVIRIESPLPLEKLARGSTEVRRPWSFQTSLN